MGEPLIIAIDGPAAAGKSTIGRKLARELGLLYIDTGSMYRAVALAVIRSGVDPHDHGAVVSLASRLRLDLKGDPDSLEVYLEGRNITGEIRSEEVTQMSSIISMIPGVRRAMVSRQRELGRSGAVLNGRDIGTVVFPDAQVKFFLTASAKERAERRFAETGAESHSFGEVLEEIIDRDRRDSTRTDSPLAVAKDAVVIDSTGLSIEEVFDRVLRTVQAKTKVK